MEVVLVRHTHVGVPKGTCYGWTDVPVADTFLEEADATKSNLEQYGQFDDVYSSPLTRARKLAAHCGYANPTVDERLKEMNMGDWEMQRFDDIKDTRLQLWYDDFMHVAPTGGESFPQLYARVSAFLDELRTKKHHRVAVFAHGGVLICAGIYAGLVPSEGCFRHLVECGGIEVIQIVKNEE